MARPKAPSKPKPFRFTSVSGKRRIAKNIRSKTTPNQCSFVFLNPSKWSTKPPKGWSSPETWKPCLDTLLTTTQGVCLACGDETEEPDNCECSLEAFRAKDAQWKKLFELKEVEGMGVGVFAKQRIGPRTVVGEYTGVLNPPGHLYDYGEVGYHVEVPLGPSIFSEVFGTVDATYEGSFVRFVNHSCNAKANLVTGRVGRTRVSAIMMKGNRAVKAGEELTVNYGPVYFQGKYCYCGYRRCKYPDPNT
ncbi:SET domain-containing protein [Mytilinidion resinicola]|uniref:SET domain-containing protein n=1 Tax=Mytilinidion resinicola TaxID=574789 RepID=A0A6A6Z5T3_9PEZI|nr:SET domain-containing protein [Mytilinidion resinicola]KAF2816023.1 SET domain-containing protein [Mytilinidion resinicola]